MNRLRRKKNGKIIQEENQEFLSLIWEGTWEFLIGFPPMVKLRREGL